MTDPVEAAARLMCEFDGLNPDEDVLVNLRMEPRWRTREFYGRAGAVLAFVADLRREPIEAGVYSLWAGGDDAPAKGDAS